MTQKAKRITPKKLKGFQDYNPTAMRRRYKVMDTLRKHASLAGFESISTPAIEYSEVLLGVGGETDKQVYKFEDNGQREVALRFDLTVPFARYVSEHLSELNLPFKRLQIGQVWRAEKPQKGRYREFSQCDLDIIGSDNIAADFEVIQCFLKTIEELEVGPFTCSINHRGILSALLEVLLKTDSSNETDALIAIDKLDKVGVEKVKVLLQEIEGVEHSRLDEFLALITKEGSAALEPIKNLLADHPNGLEAVKNTELFLDFAKNCLTLSSGHLKLNLSIARGLGYYTGIVFETSLDALPEFGSICSGGRYDRLVERFSSQTLSGVGGSLGLDRLVAAMDEIKMQTSCSPVDVFVAIAGESNQVYALQLTEKLRALGIKTDIAFKIKKLAQQFKHANRISTNWVLTVGDEERETSTCSIKNMSTGEEIKKLEFNSLISHIKTS